jgi:Na+-transporting methylmalonyl-CoA/oxaloacetate decarboxylase beta subunit
LDLLLREAGSIGIIGGADGPTAIFTTTQLAPHLLGSIAIRGLFLYGSGTDYPAAD